MDSDVKIRYRQTIEAVVIRCGCAVRGQHPGQPCPYGWSDDQGIISESEGSFDIEGDPVELAEELEREAKKSQLTWMRKRKEIRNNGKPTQQPR